MEIQLREEITNQLVKELTVNRPKFTQFINQRAGEWSDVVNINAFNNIPTVIDWLNRVEADTLQRRMLKFNRDRALEAKIITRSFSRDLTFRSCAFRAIKNYLASSLVRWFLRTTPFGNQVLIPNPNQANESALKFLYTSNHYSNRILEFTLPLLPGAADYRRDVARRYLRLLQYKLYRYVNSSASTLDIQLRDAMCEYEQRLPDSNPQYYAFRISVVLDTKTDFPTLFKALPHIQKAILTLYRIYLECYLKFSTSSPTS